jgi:hypothetical protein
MSSKKNDRMAQSEWKVYTMHPETSDHIDIHSNQVLAVGIGQEYISDLTSVAICGHAMRADVQFNAALIADAGNTYRLTGMMPSEMAHALGIGAAPKVAPAKQSRSRAKPGRKATPK